jgi:hypothetical protein
LAIGTCPTESTLQMKMVNSMRILDVVIRNLFIVDAKI